jgi:L-ribulose-5-phosphate 3-epimerase
MLPAAERTGVELHLETDLDPDAFRRFLSQVEHPLVKVNYDSGNSASLGYHPTKELAAYGERVGSVHIKDRVRGGSTVPLGTGDTDFEALFAGLRGLRYSGDFVLQVARGVAGEEVEWARQNLAFVDSYLRVRSGSATN